MIDAAQCIGDLPKSLTGTLDNPKISEAGRRFLATQLAKLSDRQIRDIFRVSNVVKRGEEIDHMRAGARLGRDGDIERRGVASAGYSDAIASAAGENQEQ